MRFPSDEEYHIKDELEKRRNKMDTEVIRISKENYEMLRTKAFFDRRTIRQLADEILSKELKKKDK